MAEFFYADVTILDTTKSVHPLVFFAFFTSVLFSIRWVAMMCLRCIANDAKLRFAFTYLMQIDCLKCSLGCIIKPFKNISQKRQFVALKSPMGCHHTINAENRLQTALKQNYSGER